MEFIEGDAKEIVTSLHIKTQNYNYRSDMKIEGD
jgi:hypothetical protein